MGLLDGLVRCYEHGCPLIEIGGAYVCLFEHVNGLIGGQRIADVVPGDRQTPTRLVFSSGKTLSLYCAHCGGPAHFDDVDDLLDQGTGLIVAALTFVEPDGDAVGRDGGLGVFFAKTSAREDLEAALADDPLITHLRSAREIR